MTGTVISAGIAASLSVVALSGAPSIAQERCSVRGGKVVLQNQSTVVFSRGRTEDRAPIFFGCAFRSGRTVRLNRRIDRQLEGIRTDSFVLAGRFVAFEQGLPGGGSPGADQVQLIVVDLGRRRSYPGPSAQEISGVVLRRDGIATAVLGTLGQGGALVNDVVQVSRGEAGRVLDSGAIAPGSLALSTDGRVVYWLKDGQPRSAPSG